MKKYFLILAGIAAVMMANTLCAQTTQDGVAKVVSLKGAARYMVATGSDWQQIKVGMLLKPGAIIQTASDSYVDLVLNNIRASQGFGSGLSEDTVSAAPPSADSGGAGPERPKAAQDAIRIFENTVLSLDKLTITKTGAEDVNETQLDLKAGRIFGTVKKLSGASIYEIKVPNGVAGIRGTIYLIGADGNLAVLSGGVVISFVSNGSMMTKNVPAGFQFDPTTGEVTPLGPTALKQMIRLSQVFVSYRSNATPTPAQNPDTTIYPVSPVIGK